MNVLLFILMLVAFLCFVLAAFKVQVSPHVHLGWMGVSLLTLTYLVQAGLVG